MTKDKSYNLLIVCVSCVHVLCCVVSASILIIVTKFFVEVRTRPRRTAGKYVKVIVVESNVGEDDEWSNDSAVFTGSDVASRQ